MCNIWKVKASDNLLTSFHVQQIQKSQIDANNTKTRSRWFVQGSESDLGTILYSFRVFTIDLNLKTGRFVRLGL